MSTVVAVSDLSTSERPSLWTRLRYGTSVIREEPDWATFVGVDWPERIMAEEVTDRFHAKQGRSIGRWTLTQSGETLVVYLKRHYLLPRRHGLLAVLFPRSAWSPGLEEWEHLNWASKNGLPVPRVVAGGELRGPWGRLQSFLAVEELADMLPLHEAIPAAFRALTPEQFSRWKRGLIAELARLSRELHRRRYYHQDLYLCHFYIAEPHTREVPTAWTDRVVMIDFHRLAKHALGWPWWQAKDLGQLLFSTFGVAGITVRDRLRFWKLYRNGDWGSATPPPRWIALAAKTRARRNDRHNAKRGARAAG